MVDGLHGEVGLNVQLSVEEEVRQEKDHALILNHNLEELTASERLRNPKNATKVRAQ